MRAEGVYGRVIPRFIDQALNNKPITIFGDGSQTRSFCFVTDQVEGLLKLAFSEGAKGEVVNIGNNKEITILELAKLVKELKKSSSEIAFHPLPEDDPPRRKADITKAKTLLNWEPKGGIVEDDRMV
jgi:UDP-glucuronate decarboxylase